jgi:hypothetical protein
MVVAEFESILTTKCHLFKLIYLSIGGHNTP